MDKIEVYGTLLTLYVILGWGLPVALYFGGSLFYSYLTGAFYGGSVLVYLVDAYVDMLVFNKIVMSEDAYRRLQEEMKAPPHNENEDCSCEDCSRGG